MTNDALIPTRPTHIILFRYLMPGNVRLLTEVLQAQPLPGPSARSSRAVLSTASGVQAQVYRSLGVATATLDARQVSELQVLGDVLAIFPNQERRIPEGPELQATQVNAVPTEDTFAQIGLQSGGDAPTGRGVKVAVLDTGVDLSHPDLTVLPGNAVSFVASEPTADDLHGHGTHCAGVVAGSATPASGRRYGVAPDVTLLVAKVLDASGFGTDDQIIDAIDWAVDQGAEILSMSLGSVRGAGVPYNAPYELIARRLLDQGVLMVAATGNDSHRPTWTAPVQDPAACPSILGVAAVDHRDRVASFSCGNVDGIGAVDLAAPGVGILSAWPGGGVHRISGTSMATPHVAGVAALYAERNPALSGRALWSALTGRARAVPGLAPADVGAGIVQAP
ncbi:S8 family serine peptidase [Deinococcus sp. HMF7604]|uniref:S8 family peptidase n=1 Tax=Deinococcus betulae TaxID=2873312 RepID=UPI001CCC9CC7|nr:S8 family serine peptidase [Deinococcus betulae]MBZ9751786.1 S8 family serine peptidase [Deinococcus betulae]